ncbi:MAG: ABC transporter substrate-binding protein [Anaerocolumna aminovalerica]|jgi:iron complex transport system substrate-binding protein|uniref:ABC transporter substrate-binding protein n=1 Tax=Anaerocolumna aminovalerica TaxID=1527 RepID=UPI001C0F0222|nr:ABC transporter substrate-binding protein [Anaerocolumna aminovalerica]MBU5331775.1 ABC transporter substrate-binding protein [Anaerocolumna aminovalerica]MDU6264009.1 ABC transporter substrate-binding protein [Anaerocolumna aminovalerica]
MKYLRKILAILCCMTLVFGLVACNSKADNVSKNSDVNPAGTSEEKSSELTTTPVPEVPGSLPEATKYPVTITDSEGTEVTFDSEPIKVVSMAPNITETVYQLELESKLVGRTDYCDFPKEALSVESVGTLTNPDIEKIISLEPDIVIASTHFSEESNKKLTDLGVKVIVLYAANDVEGAYSIIETMGTIFNVNEAAATAVKDMQMSIEETKALIKGLDKPSVYYVVGFGEYGDYTAGGDTFISQMLTEAGGNNIAQAVSGWSYTLESLVEADPDIIIISEDMKSDFETAENYKDLTAVKNGRVYGIDKNIIERQGYRNAEGLRTLAEIMHPEAFK